MNAGANAEGAEKLQRAQRGYGGERKRRRSYAEVAEGIPKLFEMVGKQHLPAITAPSQKPVIPAQAGIHGCASYDDGLPPRAFAGQVGAS